MVSVFKVLLFQVLQELFSQVLQEMFPGYVENPAADIEPNVGASAEARKILSKKNLLSSILTASRGGGTVAAETPISLDKEHGVGRGVELTVSLLGGGAWGRRGDGRERRTWWRCWLSSYLRQLCNLLQDLRLHTSPRGQQWRRLVIRGCTGR